MSRLRRAAAHILALAPLWTASAQWFDIKTPGIPRLPDGKPDLTAPWSKLANGQSDLAGVWLRPQLDGVRMENIFTPDAERLMLPKTAEVYEDNKNTLTSGFQGVTCMPYGPVALLWTDSAGAHRIYQNSASVAILFHNLTHRIAHLDGRALPKDPNPVWMGYSVGHWESDTLVIESAGFRAETWLDYAGHPHGEQLRVTERLRRRDFGHIDYEATFDDPEYYRAPFAIKGAMTYAAGLEPLEYVCHENNRDPEHMVRLSPSARFDVPVQELEKYTGTYLEQNGRGRTTVISISQGKLIQNGTRELIPTGPGQFMRAPPGEANPFTFAASAGGTMSMTTGEPDGIHSFVREAVAKGGDASRSNSGRTPIQ